MEQNEMEHVNIDSNIGKTLRRYRRERGITQEELAVALNMGMTTISAYENGRIMPTPDIVSQLMAEMSKERPTSWADTGFGLWLKDELKVRGLSSNWLADQTGIALSTVDRYISGKSHPTSRLANEIERKLLWYDEDPEARRTVKRKADRKNVSKRAFLHGRQSRIWTAQPFTRRRSHPCGDGYALGES